MFSPFFRFQHSLHVFPATLNFLVLQSLDGPQVFRLVCLAPGTQGYQALSSKSFIYFLTLRNEGMYSMFVGPPLWSILKCLTNTGWIAMKFFFTDIHVLREWLWCLPHFYSNTNISLTTWQLWTKCIHAFPGPALSLFQAHSVIYFIKNLNFSVRWWVCCYDSRISSGL